MRFLKKKKYATWQAKKIFYNLVAERTEKIEKLHNGVNLENLVYHFNSPTKNIDFNDFIYAEIRFNDIKSKN